MPIEKTQARPAKRPGIFDNAKMRVNVIEKLKPISEGVKKFKLRNNAAVFRLSNAYKEMKSQEPFLKSIFLAEKMAEEENTAFRSLYEKLSAFIVAARKGNEEEKKIAGVALNDQKSIERFLSANKKFLETLDKWKRDKGITDWRKALKSAKEGK